MKKMIIGSVIAVVSVLWISGMWQDAKTQRAAEAAAAAENARQASVQLCETTAGLIGSMSSRVDEDNFHMKCIVNPELAMREYRTSPEYQEDRAKEARIDQRMRKVESDMESDK